MKIQSHAHSNVERCSSCGVVGTQGITLNVEMSGIGVDFSYFPATICFSFSLINTVFFFIWGGENSKSCAYNVEQCKSGGGHSG